MESCVFAAFSCVVASAGFSAMPIWPANNRAIVIVRFRIVVFIVFPFFFGIKTKTVLIMHYGISTVTLKNL